MMYCPVCETKPLKRETLESNLQVHSCEACGGVWIALKAYHQWLEMAQNPTPVQLDDIAPAEIHDTQRALLCPDCGRFLIKFHVGRGLTFTVDRCGGCSGIWLDKNEWEALKTKDLHGELHHILTQEWQKQTQHEAHMERMQKMYAEKFGEADYTRAREIREWLAEHPKRAMLLGYLNDKDPYDL